MQFQNKRNIINILSVLGAFVIVSLILWNTNIFFKKFKEEERQKMEIWGTAQAEFTQSPNLETELGDLILTVLRNNTTTPMILISNDGIVELNNIPNHKASDTIFVNNKILDFKNENLPIEINYKGEHLSTLYYGNSEVLIKLKYYPVALLLIIFLFAAVIFFFFRTNKISEQNKLWAGMAKETAHQIGTPLSSLLGWNEILKSENISPDITQEIEKDIDRLHTITERFSKIGSLPILEKMNIASETKNAYDYLKIRTSKLIDFELIISNPEIFVMLNQSLFHWTIENLVKNAIDAMKGKGKLTLSIEQRGNLAYILVSDSGKGIAKKNQQTIFNPGFTTKKRGWGLGLSLVKRIVEDYHDGKIKVLSSSKDNGTVMQVTLKIIQTTALT